MLNMRPNTFGHGGQAKKSEEILIRQPLFTEQRSDEAKNVKASAEILPLKKESDVKSRTARPERPRT